MDCAGAGRPRQRPVPHGTGLSADADARVAGGGGGGGHRFCSGNRRSWGIGESALVGIASVLRRLASPGCLPWRLGHYREERARWAETCRRNVHGRGLVLTLVCQCAKQGRAAVAPGACARNTCAHGTEGAAAGTGAPAAAGARAVWSGDVHCAARTARVESRRRRTAWGTRSNLAGRRMVCMAVFQGLCHRAPQPLNSQVHTSSGVLST
jgi:hypothetical protein